MKSTSLRKYLSCWHRPKPACEIHSKRFCRPLMRDFSNQKNSSRKKTKLSTNSKFTAKKGNFSLSKKWNSLKHNYKRTESRLNSYSKFLKNIQLSIKTKLKSLMRRKESNVSSRTRHLRIFQKILKNKTFYSTKKLLLWNNKSKKTNRIQTQQMS